MATTLRTDLSELEPLSQRLKAWRDTRSLGQRIPEELWKAAADLARVHGLSRTATALKLSYRDLQRRLWGGEVQRRQGHASAAAFVELAPAALPGQVPSSTLELVKTSGARLILRLPSARPRDLLPVVQLFLRHR